MSRIHILGVSGSLRTGSLNSALLSSAQLWAQESTRMQIDIYDRLADIPPFDPDHNEPTACGSHPFPQRG